MTRRFSYDTLVGMAEPAESRKSVRGEVNRVVHTLSHLSDAMDTTREWVMTYSLSDDETKDLRGVLDLVSELDEITKQAIHQLEESNSE